MAKDRLPPNVQTALDQLLLLPPAQRLAAGEQLIASVPPEFDEAVAEWERSVEEYDQGKSKAFTTKEVFAEAERAIHEASQVARGGETADG